MSRTNRTVALVILTASLALHAGETSAQGAPALEPDPLAAPPSVKRPEGPRQGVAQRRVDGDVARQASEGTKALLDDRPAEAMLRYDQAQVKAPDVAELAYNRGLAALLAGRNEEARQSFELAQKLREEQVKSDPETAPSELLDEDGRFNDGHAAWQEEDLPRAVQRWASVVARDGEAGDARKNLELALRMLEVQQQEQEQQQQQQQQSQPEQQDEDQDQQPQEPGQDQEQPQPQEPQEQEQEQPRQPEERPGEMNRQQAEQLLEALEAAEKQAMEEKQEAKARRAGPASGKIW